MESLTLGDVEITRLQEWAGPNSTMSQVVADCDRDELEKLSEWLVPDFWNPADDAYHMCLQSWLVRSGGRTILIDTGVGNDKDRPLIPEFHQMRSDFLDTLAAAGAQPGDIDLVICTHVHVDHVGWNTRLCDGEWIPTFPNATYLFSRTDFDFWNPRNGHTQHGAFMNAGMFADSVAPVHAAGQAQLWEGTRHRVDENVWIESAPGHTPGLGVVHVESGGDRAVFVGDVLHSPCQIVKPEWNSCFCEDPVQARATRHRILTQAAEANALVIPAHFAGAHACEVAKDGNGFAIKSWAAR